MPAVCLWLLASLAGCEAGESAPGPEPEPGYTEPEYGEPVFADGQYVKVGSRSHVIGGSIDLRRAADGVIAVSTDGTNWKVTVMPESGFLWDVAFGDGRWLVVGSQLVPSDGDFDPVKVAFTAPTGGEWEPAADPPDAICSIAYGVGRWVAAGNNGLAQALDAGSWKPIAKTETLWWSPGVDFLGGVFVAYGEGPALLDSADGVTWSFFDTGLTAITDVEETNDGGVVAHGYHDCCFGEVPGGHTNYALTRTAEGNWTVSEE